MYTTYELTKLFNTSTETIRQWSKEFKDFLHQPANPGPNRARQFDDQDMQVMTLIAEYKARHQRPDEITTALLNGERREPPDIPPKVKVAERGKFAALERQVSDMTAALALEVNNGQQKIGKIELLEKQLFEANIEIRKLIAENAVLRAKCE